MKQIALKLSQKIDDDNIVKEICDDYKPKEKATTVHLTIKQFWET